MKIPYGQTLSGNMLGIYSKRTVAFENIIIVNYDQLQTRVFPVGPLKAYLRLGLDIDFANRKHSLLREVRDRLGLPNHKPKPKWADKKYRVECFSHEEHRPPMLLSIIDMI